MVGKTRISDGLVFESIVLLIITLFCIIVLYPLIFILSSSFSNGQAILANQVKFLPVDFTWLSYRKVFINSEVWRSYINTIVYTVVGTAVNVLMTTLAAYPLSRKDFFGKNLIMSLFVFTMFFSGGMIPTFLVVKSLGLINTMWALILPTSVSTFNLIIMRTFFQNTIPGEVQEAAIIDGCNDFDLLFRIVLPLSQAIIAVMVLFYGVGMWNSWFPALLYMQSRSGYPLQLILREIVLQSTAYGMTGGDVSDQEMIGQGIKFATMVIATFPILCLYPFLQKYFIKGVMIGAVKG
jgi:putative aldouronate transport system permease protein